MMDRLRLSTLVKDIEQGGDIDVVLAAQAEQEVSTLKSQVERLEKIVMGEPVVQQLKYEAGSPLTIEAKHPTGNVEPSTNHAPAWQGAGIMYRLLVWLITLGAIYTFGLYVVLPSKGYRRVTNSPTVERTFQLDEPVILDYFTSELQCKEWQTYRDKNGALHARCTDDAYGRGRGGKG